MSSKRNAAQRRATFPVQSGNSEPSVNSWIAITFVRYVLAPVNNSPPPTLPSPQVTLRILFDTLLIHVRHSPRSTRYIPYSILGLEALGTDWCLTSAPRNTRKQIVCYCNLLISCLSANLFSATRALPCTISHSGVEFRTQTPKAWLCRLASHLLTLSASA